MPDREETLNIDRMLPHDSEAETSVIGSLLQDEGALHVAIEYLRAEDFYKSECQHIFRAASELFEYGIKVDVISIGHKLIQMGKFDDVGGNYRLTWYVSKVPSAANCEYHCRIVKEYSQARRAIAEASMAVNSLFDNKYRADDIIGDLTMRLIEMQTRSTHRAQWVSLAQVVSNQIEEIGKFITSNEKGKRIFGLSTGFTDIDEITSGLKKSDLIIIAARPSQGKTALALNLAKNVANLGSGTVGIFSLEMANAALGNRDISSDASLNSHRLMSGNVSKVEFTNAARKILAEIQKKEKVRLIDRDVFTPAQIFVSAMRLKTEFPDLCLLVIDYLQLMKCDNPRMSETEKVTLYSGSLKQLAKNMDIPVIALSQLSRAVEERADKRPQLSDLRQSGAIEQDADVVMFIYRPDVYDKTEPGIADIIIAKQRNGPTGTVKLRFIEEYTKFTNLDRTHRDDQNRRAPFTRIHYTNNEAIEKPLPF